MGTYAERKLVEETSAVKLLTQHICGDLDPDDDDLLHDTIEGETELFEVMNKVLFAIAQDQKRVEGAKALRDEIDARKKRLEARIDRRKVMIGNALKIARLKRAECAMATVSITDAKPIVEVVNEAEIPAEYFKTEPKLDKTALNKACMIRFSEIEKAKAEGVPPEELPQEIPGTLLTGFGEQIQIRTK